MVEKTQFKYCVRVRETGEIIDYFKGFPYARKAIKEYEEEDKADGCYQEGFYEVAMRADAESPWEELYIKPKERHNDTALTIRLPKEVIEAGKAKAKRTGVSFSSAIKMLISEWSKD